MRFTIQLDERDTLTYAFGGGELGAEGTGMIISGDDHVTYSYGFPYNYPDSQEVITKEYQLTRLETEVLFQSLVDAGLFDLTYMETLDADVERTNIIASFDGYEVEASMDGTPHEAIHGLIQELITKIDPDRS